MKLHFAETQEGKVLFTAISAFHYTDRIKREKVLKNKKFFEIVFLGGLTQFYRCYKIYKKG